MSRTVLLYSVALLLGPTACLNSGRSPGAGASSTGQTTSSPAKVETPMMRRIDLTLLGPVSDVKGMVWPGDPNDMQRSVSIEEPCELTIRLPSGRVLKMRTRPILVITREGDVVVSISAPPDDLPGSLPDKAREMEKLVRDWEAAPTDRMRESIDLLKSMAPSPKDGAIHGGIERVGSASLDTQSQLLFSLYIAEGGRTTLNAHISARNEDWIRLLREHEARKVVTRPTSN